MEARVDGGCDCVVGLDNADGYEVVLLLERFQRFVNWEVRLREGLEDGKLMVNFL